MKRYYVNELNDVVVTDCVLAGYLLGYGVSPNMICNPNMSMCSPYSNREFITNKEFTYFCEKEEYAEELLKLIQIIQQKFLRGDTENE